jgi:hypothetical protein
MAELAPGERSYNKQLRPPPGFHTVSAVRIFCGMTSQKDKKKFDASLAELGVELSPFVRSESYTHKVYKSRYRWLTDEEAKRIIAYWAVRRRRMRP